MERKTLDGKFTIEEDKIILKRKGVCRGGRPAGYDYIEPFVEHPEKTRAIIDNQGFEADIVIGSDNKDIFYAAKQAGYKESEPFEYEIIIKKKE